MPHFTKRCSDCGREVRAQQAPEDFYCYHCGGHLELLPGRDHPRYDSSCTNPALEFTHFNPNPKKEES